MGNKVTTYTTAIKTLIIDLTSTETKKLINVFVVAFFEKQVPVSPEDGEDVDDGFMDNEPSLVSLDTKEALAKLDVFIKQAQELYNYFKERL